MNNQVMSMDQYLAKQELFIREKIHEQAQKMDAIFVNELYSMMESGEGETEDPITSSPEEKAYQEMFRQIVTQESVKRNKGHLSQAIEKELLRLQFGSEALEPQQANAA